MYNLEQLEQIMDNIKWHTTIINGIPKAERIENEINSFSKLVFSNLFFSYQ